MSEVRRTGGPGAIRLLARRFRTQLAAQLGIAAVVLIVCITGVITSIGLDLASTVGGRELLRDAPASQASLAVQTGLAADGSAQDAAMRSVFAQRFAGIPIQITRTVSVATA